MGCGSSLFLSPPSKDTTYRLWSPVSQEGDGIMKMHLTDNIFEVKCDGTFQESDANTKMTTEEKPQGPSNPHCFALLFKEANKQYALKRTEDGRVTIEETKRADNKSYVFQFMGLGGFTMLKHFESQLYLGCDRRGTVTLVENANRLYPNPQTVFILNKVGSGYMTTE